MCAYPHWGLPSFAEVAAHNRAPQPPPGWGCDSRRFLVRIVPPIPGLWLCFTHSSCVCNDLISAYNRVVGVVPMPTQAGLAALKRSSARLSWQVPHQKPWSYERVIAHFTGSRRLRYQRALDNVRANGLSRSRHARISAFVKSEKFNPEEKCNPDPRMIQARTPEYGVEVARYLKPIEKCIYGLRGPTGLRIIAKGLNQTQRAQLLVAKLAQFSNPVVMSLDCSRWDKHCTERVLQVEHSFYLRACSDPYFQRLLSWQLDNRCRTNNGVSYRVRGGRMSGDMNTALGNCLLAVIMIHAAAEGLGPWDCLDDGDDLLYICESVNANRALAELPVRFRSYGQELKIEGIARTLWDVTFCQCRVVVGPGGPMFVRDWRKVLSHGACGVGKWGDRSGVRPMLAAVGMCELALGRGVPVLQEYALALIRNARGHRPRVDDFDRGYQARVRAELGVAPEWSTLAGVCPVPITPGARASFDRTWGLSLPEQLAIEARLRQWSVDSVDHYTVGPEWDCTWERRVQLDVELPKIM